MIKIFLTVRNRLAITKKCIHALKKHSKIPHTIYVYDNASNYRVEEHFMFFNELYQKGFIKQVTFTTEASTFKAFSKASTCNFFGLQHEQDPKKDSYDFLLMLDNDIILTPGWDTILKTAWDYVKEKKLKHVKVIGQLPGGIKGKFESHTINKDLVGRVGTLGGSGLWSVKPDFFRTVGFLDLRTLVGHDKKHDQNYWRLLQQSSPGKPYIMGVNKKLGIHCGKQAGSVCNRLTRNRNSSNKCDLIKFENAEKRIDSMDFQKFYNSVYNDKALIGDW